METIIKEKELLQQDQLLQLLKEAYAWVKSHL
jgi:hypothetical protein